MIRRILCFGDSNTYGYCADPRDSAGGGGRFTSQERWPCLLQAALGPDFLVLEEGLTGRTTVYHDAVEGVPSGLESLPGCLAAHAPLDLLIFMLGTNDTKERFGAGPEDIARGMERLVCMAQEAPCWRREPNILLLSPPPIDPAMDGLECCRCMGRGCPEKSRELAARYRELAARLGCRFLDAGESSELSPADWMHLTRRGHRLLAERLARTVPALL